MPKIMLRLSKVIEVDYEFETDSIEFLENELGVDLDKLTKDDLIEFVEGYGDQVYSDDSVDLDIYVQDDKKNSWNVPYPNQIKTMFNKILQTQKEEEMKKSGQLSLFE